LPSPAASFCIFDIILLNMKKIALIFFGLFILLISLSAQYVDSFGSVDYYHTKIMDADNYLDSWHKDENGPFEYIIGLNAGWWKNAPFVEGFPIWCTAAEVTPEYEQSTGAIPGSACYFAIMACLKYYVYTGDTAFLSLAIKTGKYIVEHDLTSAAFIKYPKFPYAVGSTGSINPLGFGHPWDGDPRNPIYSIQPDKGAMIGVALLELYKITNDTSYLSTSINIANCLADNAVTGTDTNSPWPFRVMADDGSTFDGVFDGNVSFSCRLFDELLRIGQSGNGKYKTTRDSVWKWLKEQVIAWDDASKWMHFFEDHSGNEVNPTQINALETVRYLLEKKNQADPDWLNLSRKIITQVTRRWAVTSLESDGYVSIAEQESDWNPFNSHAARYGSILAMFSEASGITACADTAYHSLCYSAYSVEDNGFTSTFFNNNTMAWTTDSFGDFLYHFMQAMAAVPQWAGSKNHLLKSSGTIRKVTYVNDNTIEYTVFDESGTDKLKLTKGPVSVKVNGAMIKTWIWDNSSKVLIINRSTGKNVTIELDKSVSLSPASLVLIAGGTAVTIAATVLPDTLTDKKLTWKSSSPGVATVSQSGVVTPVSAGTSEITATTADGYRSASCIVTVVVRIIHVTGISVQPGNITLFVGGPAGSVAATLLPANSTNKNVLWSSSFPGIATVSATGAVLPISPGTTDITATSEDGGKTAVCVVTVELHAAPSKPVLLIPENNETNLPDNPVMKWESALNTISYWIQVSLNTTFTSAVLSQSEVKDTTINLSNLEKNTLYYWRVNATNSYGTSPWSDIWSFTTALDDGIEQSAYNQFFELKQNYPNPFTSCTTIEFSISGPGRVEIAIYNVMGEKVCDIINESLEAGSYKKEWSPPSGLGSGLYYCKMMAGGSQSTKLIVYNR
jgi:uncharacterized protein YjdB